MGQTLKGTLSIIFFPITIIYFLYKNWQKEKM
jgi:hypothetical protein